MKPTKVLTTLMVGVGLLTGTAYAAIAQQPATPSRSNASTTTDRMQPAPRSNVGAGKTQLAEQDRQFLTKAAQGGMAEVTLSRLAAQRASSSAVKNFANRMVTDHTQANQTLMQLARSKGFTPPQTMDAEHKALRARIGQIPAPRFDQVYMEAMVKDHANTVALFEQQATRGQDPDLKAFAAQTLPTLRDHLQAARKLAPNVTAKR